MNLVYSHTFVIWFGERICFACSVLRCWRLRIEDFGKCSLVVLCKCNSVRLKKMSESISIILNSMNGAGGWF